MGVLPPGQHTLDASELPFLGMFIDWASAGNAFKCELYFVGTREYPNVRFGGRIDDIQDPQSQLIVTLRTFGEYALKIEDPTKLILNLVGTVDVSNNDAVTDWVGQQLLKVLRTAVTTQLASGAWPILGLSMHSPDIEAAAMPAANAQLADYGITICRFGNLDVNLADEDSARLKKLGDDYAYSRLAGGFLQAAQAEALQGAGPGRRERSPPTRRPPRPRQHRRLRRRRRRRRRPPSSARPATARCARGRSSATLAEARCWRPAPTVRPNSVRAPSSATPAGRRSRPDDRSGPPNRARTLDAVHLSKTRRH